jgi:hypothetical protein
MSLWLGMALTAALAAGWAVALHRRQGRRYRQDLEALRVSMESRQMVCLEMFAEAHRSIASLEERVSVARETPKSGALSRSARAQAMQLLRSGLSADTVAGSVGAGRREIRLLERVSHVLCDKL